MFIDYSWNGLKLLSLSIIYLSAIHRGHPTPPDFSKGDKQNTVVVLLLLCHSLRIDFHHSRHYSYSLIIVENPIFWANSFKFFLLLVQLLQRDTSSPNQEKYLMEAYGSFNV